MTLTTSGTLVPCANPACDALLHPSYIRGRYCEDCQNPDRRHGTGLGRRKDRSDDTPQTSTTE